MAGHSIGSIFAELNLDADPFNKKLDSLKRDAGVVVTNVEKNFQTLGIKSAEHFNLLRAKAENAYQGILHSSTTTANDILRAEQARAETLTRLHEQQHGRQVSLVDSLKQHWLGASVAIVAAWGTVTRAVALMDEGARAMQVESSFKLMAEAAGVNADKMIAAMKEATRETIDDSALMAKAVKLMTLGFDPAQIERFSSVVITAAHIAGTTAAQAYDELADAIGNRQPKAMIRMGAITREQMEVVNKAIDAGASSMELYELAMANLELKTKMLQGTTDAAVINMQRFHTIVGELQETMGKGLIIVVDAAFRAFEYLTAGVLGLVSAYRSYRAVIYEIIGDEAKAAENREIANTFQIARNMLIEKSAKAIFLEGEVSAKASKEELAASQAKVDAKLKELSAYKTTKETEKKLIDETAKLEKKANEDFIRGWVQRIEEQQAADFKAAQEEVKRVEDLERTEKKLYLDFAREHIRIEEEEAREIKEAWEAYYKYLRDEEAKRAEQTKKDYEAAKAQMQVEEEERRIEREAWDAHYKYLETVAGRDGSVWDSLRSGARSAYAALGTFSENIARGVAETFRNLSTALSDVFFNVLIGKFNNLIDIVKNFGLSVLRTFTDILAAEATKSLLSLFNLGGTKGGTESATGGLFSAIGTRLAGGTGGTEGKTTSGTGGSLANLPFGGLLTGVDKLTGGAISNFLGFGGAGTAAGTSGAATAAGLEAAGEFGALGFGGAAGAAGAGTVGTIAGLEAAGEFGALGFGGAAGAATAGAGGGLMAGLGSFGIAGAVLAALAATTLALNPDRSEATNLKIATALAHNPQAVAGILGKMQTLPGELASAAGGAPWTYAGAISQALVPAEWRHDVTDEIILQALGRYLGFGAQVAAMQTAIDRQPGFFRTISHDENYPEGHYAWGAGGPPAGFTSRAGGGPVEAGVGYVGHGPDPEPFVSSRGGYVLSHQEARQIYADTVGGGGVTVHAHLHIDGKEVTDTVVRGVRSGDADLIRYLRMAVA